MGGIFIAGMLFQYYFLWNQEENSAAMEQKTLDGLALRGPQNWTQAFETARNLDPISEWVCVNVLGMGINRSLQTCQHECSHVCSRSVVSEIIAQEVGNNQSLWK